MTRVQKILCGGVAAAIITIVLLITKQDTEPGIEWADPHSAFAVFYQAHIKDALERLRKNHPDETTREILDACMGTYDRDIVSFMAIDTPGQTIDHYASVLDREPQHPGYYISFAVERIRQRYDALSPNNYDDFLSAVMIHECLHIIHMDGRRVEDAVKTHEDKLAEESRTWWETTEYIVIPLRQSGRATEPLDNGMELAIGFNYACAGVRECPIWTRFMKSALEMPGGEDLEELTQELPDYGVTADTDTRH